MIPTDPADVDGGVCPDCLPRSMCLACLDCERFHEERDNRLEAE